MPSIIASLVRFNKRISELQMKKCDCTISRSIFLKNREVCGVCNENEEENKNDYPSKKILTEGRNL